MLSHIFAFFTNMTTRIGHLASVASDLEEQPTLLRELWDYFVDKYFTVHFEEYNYQHINMDGGGVVSIQSMIIALFIGLMIAAAASLFQKRSLGDLVRALDRERADSSDKAMTLEQLGLIRASGIKQDLRHGSVLRRVVRCVEEDAYLASQKAKRQEAELAAAEKGIKAPKWRELPYRYDFSKDHFYIPEDKMFGALTQFNQRGTNPLMLVVAIILCVVFMAVTCRLVPEMLQMADNFIGILGGD